ncbi:MAG TPA: KaiC 1, partial [Bacteroidetes bacterium]|nr:KaiC 1 [Bacteroidota bacterium]
MEKQSIYAPKIITGINVIDEAWGGLYRGGSYLLYGQAWTGRSLMNLQFAFTGVKQKERCLYIFPERPRDLII